MGKDENKKEKKRVKGLFNSFPSICRSTSSGVRVLVLLVFFDLVLVAP